MRKKMLVAPTALLLGVHLAQPLSVFARNDQTNRMSVGHYELIYEFVEGLESRPEVKIVDGGQTWSHTYREGTTGGPFSIYLNGSNRAEVRFTSRDLDENDLIWTQRPVSNTNTKLESTWDSNFATVTARLSEYEGIGVLHEYVYTNTSDRAVSIEGRRTVDTYLETDEVPIYSLGPGEGLYIRGENYRLDYFMGLDNGPDKYSGYAWVGGYNGPEGDRQMKSRIAELDNHRSAPKDSVVLENFDTAIAMEWNAQTVAPGESRTFAYVVKISGNIDANASMSQDNDVVYLDTSAYGDGEFPGVSQGSFDVNLPSGVSVASGGQAQILNSRGGVVREVPASSLVSGNKVSLSLSGGDIVDNGFRVKLPLETDSSWADRTLRLTPNLSLTGSAGTRYTTVDASTHIESIVETTTDVQYETIPVETERRENINLPEGETRVIEEGRPGREKITYEVTLTNGVETNRREVGREVDQPMVKRVVEVGSMVTEVRQEPREESIPFTHEVVENPEVFEGDERIIQEGVPGILEIIDEVTYENGQEVNRRKVSESVKVEPVPEILEVGTLMEERREEVTQETIPFEVQIVENPEMHVGTSQVVQEGVNGVLDIVEEVVYHNGHEVERHEVDRIVSKEPVVQIIEEGTLVEEIVEDIQTQEVAFETEVVENAQLEVGESRVVQEGQNGMKELIYTVTYHNGEEVDRVLIDEVIAQEPINEIIEEGTLVREILTEEKEESIGNKEETRENPDLPEGEKNVIEEGQPGVLKIVEEVVIENGIEVSRREIDREVLQEAVDRVVEVGTGVFGTLEEVDEEEIPYETEYVETDELAKDEERVVQEGVVGIKTITSVYETFNDEKIGEPEVTEEVTEEPVGEIIEVGTGIVGTTEEIEEVEIPYDTERVENKELEVGEERVTQEGVVGIKTITSVYETLDDEIVGEPDVTEEVTEEPVNEIIEVGVGVKDIDETTEEVELPYNTRRVENPNLPEGQTQVAQQGEMGLKHVITKQPTFNGEAVGEPEVTEEVIKEPVDEIIEVGTYRAPVPVQGKVMPVVQQHLPTTGEVLGTTGILAGLGSILAGVSAWWTKRKRK